MASLSLALGPDQRKYVVRELKKNLLYKFRLRQGFINGLKIRRQLVHPHILPSIGLKTVCLVPYEVLDYIPGRNLYDMVGKRRIIIQNNHLEILRQLASALAYMHSKNVVHLDVKAENVLVAFDRDKVHVHAVLTDFDLSRYLRRGRARARSGTMSYMAPEQLVSGRVGYESDIFSFGVVAYYMVAGKMPFTGFTVEEAKKKKINPRHDVESIRKQRHGISPRLEEIILGCLEKKLDRRFPTMAYLEQELRRV